MPALSPSHFDLDLGDLVLLRAELDQRQPVYGPIRPVFRKSLRYFRRLGKLSVDLRGGPVTFSGLHPTAQLESHHSEPGVIVVRKLLVSSFVSLDGVVESPMTWASPFFEDESREHALRKLDDVEFFLLGRVAYETFAPVWSTITGNAY